MFCAAIAYAIPFSILFFVPQNVSVYHIFALNLSALNDFTCKTKNIVKNENQFNVVKYVNRLFSLIHFPDLALIHGTGLQIFFENFPPLNPAQTEEFNQWLSQSINCHSGVHLFSNLVDSTLQLRDISYVIRMCSFAFGRWSPYGPVKLCGQTPLDFYKSLQLKLNQHGRPDPNLDVIVKNIGIPFSLSCFCAQVICRNKIPLKTRSLLNYRLLFTKHGAKM